MTKDEVFLVVMETQAMSEKEKQRAREMVDRLSERFPEFSANLKIAEACAIYGLALAKVPVQEPRKRRKKVASDEEKHYAHYMRKENLK